MQLPANLVEGSVPNVGASGAATGIETGQQLPFSHAAAGVGRSIPTNATPSAATAFSACRPEDAKSYRNKMFELSGFRDATTAGNWRHRNLLGTLSIGRSLVGVGAPRRTSGCWRHHEGAALPRANIVHRGARGLPTPQSSPRTVTAAQSAKNPSKGSQAAGPPCNRNPGEAKNPPVGEVRQVLFKIVSRFSRANVAVINYNGIKQGRYKR